MTIVATFLITWELYLSIFVIFIVTRIIKWLTDPLRKIPGPRGYPIIGNTLDYSLSNDLQKVLLERAKKYGKIYKDYTFFNGSTVFITDPEYAKYVLVSNSHNYVRRPTVLELLPAFGTGLLTTNGKAHAMQRKHLNPAFTATSVKHFITVFNGKAMELLEYYTREIKDGGPIERQMMDKFTDTTLDIIGICAFGYHFNSIMQGHSVEADATNTILTVNFNIVRKAFEKLIPLIKLIPSKEREELKKAEDIFYGLIEKVIASRKQEMIDDPAKTMENEDLLQKLISMYGEAGVSISNKDLFHQVFTFMIAGHETTSVTLTWTTFLLAKYPEFQTRLQSELDEALHGKSEITFEDLNKLNFLESCIKESMRLCPVVTNVGRQTIKDDKIGPYTIPAGTELVINVSTLCTSPCYWEHPEEFNPDRFSQEVTKDPLFSYYYLPFSRGPRMCIGYRFAEMELKVLLAHLLRAFSFKLAASQSPDVSGQELLTFKPNPAPFIEICQR